MLISINQTNRNHWSVNYIWQSKTC